MNVEGWFQQKERLDTSGKALTYRIVVAVVGFGLGLLVSKKLNYSMFSFSSYVCFRLPLV